ncbi:hypothetical protein GM921_09240 [Pedobacter sp. LMG 31464]|uniref:DNA polymerase III psi subunit n=1 Tax=Pedobacter planticolens TaxID=2679964 RepID=A0A923E067_9SPHI|nr:hypothetical protein [Pedobacter planticolens]MBB2145668.1 hypothetical protein [Pedobacter planticolens]
MANQLTSNAEALRLFFTDDIYLVKDDSQIAFAEPVMIKSEVVPKETVITSIMEVNTVEDLPLIVEEPKPILKRNFNFEFLGKNQKGILILVNDNVNKVSSEQGTELLRKLVKAIELTNNDFALVNYSKYNDATFEDLSEFFNCQLVLSFGVETQQLGLATQPLHQLLNLGDTRLIFTSNLHDLDSDQASKKTLWTSLQQLKNG